MLTGPRSRRVSILAGGVLALFAVSFAWPAQTHAASLLFLLSDKGTPDHDGDGRPDGCDNCASQANPDQADNDNDLIGDVCDIDDDNDGVIDVSDNCPVDANPSQADDDHDGLGNVCDLGVIPGSAMYPIEQLAAASVAAITAANPPGSNGLIAKLTGNGGVLRKVHEAVTLYQSGAIDASTYAARLQEALHVLDAYCNQLNAKIGNGQIPEPYAFTLRAGCESLRIAIQNLATCPSQPEVCDGRDNNCNNLVDENPTDAGTTCTTGTGPCSATGVNQCVNGSLVCDAQGGTASDETCNGLDDDCDGTVDDVSGIGASCSGPGVNTTGACTGEYACTGTPGPGPNGLTCRQAVGPAPETCNSLDDDCNGSTDEGFNVGTACDGADADSCTNGTLTCSADGSRSECVNETASHTDLCNGLDDDCDGSIDEDFPTKGQSCDGQDADQCASGTLECTADGSGLQCVGDVDRVEVCDGVDNNCDGTVDEGDPGGGAPCSTGQPGVCGPGTLHCVNASLSCRPDVSPSAETCNNLDDDCDGNVDNGFALGVACDGADEDLCTEGVTVCDPNGSGTTCNDVSDNNTELCNGTDDDCDGATDEGYELGVACDGPDTDLCTEGVTVCNGTGTECNDTSTNNAELCNGTDDDCDGSIDEDFPLVGSVCDGADTDLCTNGTYTCSADGSGVECVNETRSNTETCNDLDDDCDGSVDEDFPAKGQPCDGPDEDLCVTGTMQCSADGSGLLCTGDVNRPEVCDGVDNDCDGAIDDGNPGGGAACSTGQPGVCGLGTTQCTNGSMICMSINQASPERCNALDDNCNGTIDEGFNLGQQCDGSDGDQCAEGVTVCSADQTGTVCSDNTSTNVERCNGVDDDCDGAIDEGLNVGASCDGPDGDLCTEGVIVCSPNGFPTCSDNTSTNPEICNGADDDCDGLMDEGFNVGMQCDGPDGDQCREGVFVCSGGIAVCTDNTGTTSETCNGVDDDCDGGIDEDINRNDNPLCSSGQFFVGSVSGDTGAGVLTDSWTDEEWDRVRITEDDGGIFSPVYLSATVQLQSAPGTDFDLYVYCNGCSGGLAGSSTSAGAFDLVDVRANDDPFTDDTFEIIIEVRHWSSTVCAPWTLTVRGDTAVSTETCN